MVMKHESLGNENNGGISTTPSFGSAVNYCAVAPSELWVRCDRDDGACWNSGISSNRFGRILMGHGVSRYARCVDGGITGCGPGFWSEAIGGNPRDVSTGTLVVFDSGIILLVDDAAYWGSNAPDVGGCGGYSISRGLSSDHVMGHAQRVPLFRLSISL